MIRIYQPERTQNARLDAGETLDVIDVREDWEERDISKVPCQSR
jgi:rhodanese-related sulfurtransferase